MLAFGQNRDHKEVKMYTACCFMVIHVCVKFGIPMSKSKDYVMTKIHGEMYEKMYVTIVSYYYTYVPNIVFLYVKGQKVMFPNEMSCHQNPHVLTLRSKVNVSLGS